MRSYISQPLLLLVLFSMSIISVHAAVDDDDMEFNPAFIKNYAVSSDASLDNFISNNDDTPGLYSLDIDVNEQFVDRLLVKLEKSDDILQICLTEKLINSLGIIDLLMESYNKKIESNGNDTCVFLSALIPESSFNFNFSKQQLSITIPQRDLIKNIAPENNPANWNEGNAVIFSNYSFNRYTTRAEGYSKTTNSLSLNSGINLFKWRLRHDSQIYDDQYTAINTYLERDVDLIKSKLTFGDFYSGSIFSNGSSLRGVRLRNDNSMLSNRETGFAPSIQGIAKSQAQIKVYLPNSNTEIYSTVVPAGPFEINDLLPIYYSGDLLVEIIESNGEIQKMLIPIQSGLSFTRPGKIDFDIGAGKLRYKDSVFGDPIFDASMRYGVNNYLSTSLGTIASQDYLSNALGITVNTKLGAFNAEMLHSKAKLKNSNKNLEGNAYKLSYSKSFAETKTYINLSSIQYDSKNYTNAYTAMQMNQNDSNYNNQQQNNRYKLKTQYTLSMSQRLPYQLGNLNLSGSLADYWNGSSQNKQYTVSYNTNIRDIGLTTSLQKINNQFNNDTLFSMSVSIPLYSNENTMNLTSSYLSANKTQNLGIGVNGAIGESVDYFVNVGQDKYDNEQSHYGSASVNYKSSFANLSTDYSQYQDAKTLNLSTNGAIVGHSGGVLFSNTLGNSFAIIKAEGVENAHVLGADTTTNRWGYAIQPNLVPYRKNLVGIDTKDLSQQYTIEESKQMVIPRSGSAVFVDLKTKIGAPIVLRITDKNNNPLPLGATVYDDQDQSLTFVGQGGKIFLNLNAQLHHIYIHTNAGEQDICKVDLEDIIAKNLHNEKITTLNLTCTKEQ